MSRKPYQTELSDKQWNVLKSLIPLPKRGGRPRRLDMRGIINAIFYIKRQRRRRSA